MEEQHSRRLGTPGMQGSVSLPLEVASGHTVLPDNELWTECITSRLKHLTAYWLVPDGAKGQRGKLLGFVVHIATTYSVLAPGPS